MNMMLSSGRFGGGVGGHLDTQSVTTGGSGTAGLQNRIRGYTASPSVGSITDGSSNIPSGGSVDVLCYDEGSGGSATYVLAIAGNPTGWTSMTITGPNGSVTLTRGSATFASNQWAWTTADTIPTQKFGPVSSAVTVDFD